MSLAEMGSAPSGFLKTKNTITYRPATVRP